MHKRLFPKVNQFTYGVYFFALPLSSLKHIPVPMDRKGIVSISRKDHGPKDGSELEPWAREIHAQFNLQESNGEIVLLTMPRVLGYCFNPVSFWLCHDFQGKLRSVICQVNNTFGESHTYVCAHPDQRVIQPNDWLYANKAFHVSPFLEREGQYAFRFDTQSNDCGIWINYFDGEGRKKLLTSMTGRFQNLTSTQVRRAFFRYPLLTLKVIYLIHWQAFKLLSKKIKYFQKPEQINSKLSGTKNLTKS